MKRNSLSCPYLGGFFTTVHKDQHLLLASLLHHLLVTNLIHQRHALKGGLLRHSHKLLLQTNRSKTAVEVEQSLLRIHSQECGDIGIVRQGCGKSNQSHHFLRGLNLAKCTSNQGLQNRSSLVVQKVNFVDDDQTDELGVGPLA